MELKKEFSKFSKELVYDKYLSLVYDYKVYDDITRPKMIDAIIKEYGQERYLYNMCTGRELEFLKYCYDKELSMEDIKKYEWEIKELNNKCIFSILDYKIFDELKENVKKALEIYNIKKRTNDIDIAIFMISFVKTQGEMLSDLLVSMVSQLFKIDKEFADALLGHPLFHFYCDFDKEYFESLGEYKEIVYYRKYWDIIDEAKAYRKEYGIAGSLQIDVQDFFDIYYYGFPIRNKKVKKMYDEVSKLGLGYFIFDVIDEARVLNYRENIKFFIKDEKLLDIIDDALDEMPCAVMNGFSPNQYNKEMDKESELKIKFDVVPQNNAHLSKNAADEYYKLYFALLDYINKKYNISPELKRIYNEEGLDVNKLCPIDEYLWKHKEEIDEFIKENKYQFTKEELETISLFKRSVTNDMFVVIGFEREYTKILSEDGKIYMVKGVRADLDKFLNPDDLPIFIGTTLLMFKDKIIYNGFFKTNEIKFGNDIREAVLKNMDSAVTYYHIM